MKIGMSTATSSSSVYDIDEFKFCAYSATAAEIGLWANRSWAAWSSFGKSCGMWHGSINGPPRVGNSSYAFTVSGALSRF